MIRFLRIGVRDGDILPLRDSRKSIYLVMLILFLASVAFTEADTVATKAAILAADRNLAATVATKGTEAFLEALDSSAAVLIPDQPILRGASGARTAIIARYGAPSSLTWNPVHVVASTDGKLGCTMGYSRFTNARDTARTVHRGTYLTCWAKDTRGQWKIAGIQLADNPPQTPLFADSATLPGAPHSATVSIGAGALKSAQDADSAFAELGARAAGPGPAFAKYSADDAFLLGGSEFPRGPAAIAAAFSGYSADRVITWQPMRNFGLGSGGLAFTVGHSSSGPRPGKTGPAIPNKYFSVWRQEADGRWLYIFDLGTSRPRD
jgi:ketosteroid isomerase-like protein